MIERTFIEQGMKKIQLGQYLKKQLNRAGFTGLHMVKTPLVTRIILRVARPGLAIGKGGQNIRQLTEEIGKKFGIDNPQIEIQDIQNPTLDARATVDKMVELIERGFSWKSVAFRTLRNIDEAGAQGVELVLKGKLSGKGGRKRKHRAVKGYMKKVGDQVKLVDTAKASAYPKAGAIGIKLSIIRPEIVFPDKVDIGKAIKKKETEAASAKAAEEKLAEQKESAEKEKPKAIEEKPAEPATEKKMEKEEPAEKGQKPAEKAKRKEKSAKEKKEKAAKKKPGKEKQGEAGKEKQKAGKEKVRRKAMGKKKEAMPAKKKEHGKKEASPKETLRSGKKEAEGKAEEKKEKPIKKRPEKDGKRDL